MVMTPQGIADSRRPPCGGLYWQIFLSGDVLLIGSTRPTPSPQTITVNAMMATEYDQATASTELENRKPSSGSNVH